MIPTKISVGILSDSKINVEFNGTFSYLGNLIKGKQTLCYANGISFNGRIYDELLFEPIHEENDNFELKDVTIGIHFHWQKKENQQFKGSLKFIVEDEKITAINILSVEDYLTSVISSEMNATSSLELLKAHAVISRSWLLRPFSENKNDFEKKRKTEFVQEACDVIEKWYERDNHTNFDVCADDHCQRYQGITKASTENVKKAVKETKGEVLMYNNAICDARFYKSCGGQTETFDSCWEYKHYPFLESVSDSTQTDMQGLDLTKEPDAEKWILDSPYAFCNTKDKRILSQVLNDYDQTTHDFFRWTVVYKKNELSETIRNRSGIDFGEILDLIPMKRGKSGRLSFLKIIGTNKTAIVGKELEIRKWLSNTHLYSSAFVVKKQGDSFILKGAGWGHGVGLCQIGAAVMSEQGYGYKEILHHYYKNAEIKKVY